MDRDRGIGYDHTFTFRVPRTTVFFGTNNGATRESRVRLLSGRKGESRTPARLRPTPGYWGEPKPRIHPGGQDVPNKTGRNPIR